MAPLSPREHARLARMLIEKCGGLDESGRASGMSSSTLSRYQCPHEAPTMPAQVMADLESYCGEPVYSSAIAGQFAALRANGDLRAAACALTEQTASFQHRVREAHDDGVLSPAELDQLSVSERVVEEALENVRAIRRGLETPPRART